MFVKISRYFDPINDSSVITSSRAFTRASSRGLIIISGGAGGAGILTTGANVVRPGHSYLLPREIQLCFIWSYFMAQDRGILGITASSLSPESHIVKRARAPGGSDQALRALTKEN
jgi:hypothetical protein